MKQSATRDNSAAYCRMSAAPSAQLKPTARGRAWRMLLEKLFDNLVVIALGVETAGVFRQLTGEPEFRIGTKHGGASFIDEREIAGGTARTFFQINSGWFGSASTITTERPASASSPARMTAPVVFATPPFADTKLINRNA